MRARSAVMPPLDRRVPTKNSHIAFITILNKVLSTPIAGIDNHGNDTPDDN